MNIIIMYKIAKRSKRIPEYQKSLQVAGAVEENQKNRINVANELHADKINRMVTPHTTLNAAEPYEETKEAQNVLDTSMTAGRSGSIYGGHKLNEEYIKNYINQLFLSNQNNNFMLSGFEDLINTDE